MKKIVLTTLFGFSGIAFAGLDLDGNMASDLWELRYPMIELDLDDFDQDGQSNLEESIAGTDPTNANSLLALDVESSQYGVVKLGWQAVAGKGYRIEKFENQEWQTLASFLPRPTSSDRNFEVPAQIQDIFRVVVYDLDLDSDGLNAWEELQLGWSDSDPMSSGDPSRLDYIAAVRELESESGVTLVSGEQLPQQLPSEEEAARFLLQASFGPTEEEIEVVTSLGFTGWIDAQNGKPLTLSSGTMFTNDLSFRATLWKDGWIKLAVTSPDQLRQRMAYALSQIFVVGFQGGTWVGDNPFVQAKYYDDLARGVSGRYRDMLETVSYSSVMGFYLSHLRNQKSDPSINRFPDENFAREIMQLFSIGLWELNPDGTVKVDSEGNAIPTYDNGDITEMAKVFTGMSFSNNGLNGDAVGFFSGVRGNAYLHPMKMFEEEHEPGRKELLGNVILNDIENGGPVLSGEEEVQATLDMLSNHPNTAPFISKLLIQRLTSSNPSPEYVLRVVRAWKMGGSDLQGDFEKVAEAILLDPEVRSFSRDHLGKVREPIVRMTAFLRALNFKNSSETYPVNSTIVDQKLGQYPMLSPTVFNFYLPSYRPPGALSATEFVSPEMQIAGVTQVIETDNLFRTAIDSSLWSVSADYQAILHKNLNDEETLNEIELLLCGNGLLESTRQTILLAMEVQPDSLSKLKTALHLVVGAAESATVK